MIFGSEANSASATAIGRWLISNSRMRPRDLSGPKLAIKYRNPKDAWMYFAFRVVSTISAIVFVILAVRGTGARVGARQLFSSNCQSRVLLRNEFRTPPPLTGLAAGYDFRGCSGNGTTL